MGGQVERFESISPFVTLQVPGCAPVRSKVRTDTRAPQWGQDMQVPVTEELVRPKTDGRLSTAQSAFGQGGGTGEEEEEDEEEEEEEEEGDDPPASRRPSTSAAPAAPGTAASEGAGRACTARGWQQGLYFDMKVSMPLTSKEFPPPSRALRRARNALPAVPPSIHFLLFIISRLPPPPSLPY